MTATVAQLLQRQSFADRLDDQLALIRRMLIDKNRAYGNSALDPVRIFSSASPSEQIDVRLDDKLSRLKRGHAAGEDVELDLLGYLLLRRIAHALEAEAGQAEADAAPAATKKPTPCNAQPARARSPASTVKRKRVAGDKPAPASPSVVAGDTPAARRPPATVEPGAELEAFGLRGALAQQSVNAAIAKAAKPQRAKRG